MYTYDTETSNDGAAAWIWSWALCDESFNVSTGNGVDVISPLLKLPDGSEIWVHNLDYDGEFLHWELQRAGFRLVYDLPEQDKHHGVYDILCDLSGIISMRIYHEGKKITLRDSNRIFRCKLEKLPTLCGFADIDEKKKMDYEERRERDHKATPEELDYQVHDVTVLMRAMLWVRSYCSDGNTIGSIAMHEFKKSVENKSPFTPLTYEQRQRFRSLYNGGIVYLPVENQARLCTGRGRVYDRNSMYPSEALKELPVAIEREVHGQPDAPGCWAVHVQAEELALKPGGFSLIITPFTGAGRAVIPVIDKWLFFEEWEAIREEYTIKRFRILASILFKTEQFAGDFVRKWYTIKSTEPNRRNYAKYVLNNVTGKWAENPLHEQMRRKIIDKSGNYVNYRYNQIDEKPNVWQFMPATARITSNSRLCLRDAAIRSGRENLLYTDTDSIHTYGTLPPDMISKTALGAWDCENEFDVSMYIKPKSYFEALNGKTVVARHAGINNDATRALWDKHKEMWIDSGEIISADNMRAGNYFFTRQSRKCEGGIIIERKPKIL